MRFRSHAGRRVAMAIALPFALAVALASCSDGPKLIPPKIVTRTYRMGFSAIPPRADSALSIASINLWAQRADAAIILSSPPWDYLLGGGAADSAVRVLHLGLTNYYRSKGLRIIVSVDPTDGLNRGADAPELVAAGRSLTEPAVQSVYRAYVAAMDTILHPDYLAFASETNLVRAAAPLALYNALVTVANNCAADVRAVDSNVKLFASVQVEVAWGAPGGSYVGIAQDRTDFPFMDALGLSSYPYLAGFADPDSLPLDYYDRLDEGDPLPMLVIEGGWTSNTLLGGAIVSSPDKQRRYIEKHAEILDRARAVGWFQLTFTDLDTTAFPAGVVPFAFNGLVDKDLNSKPALAAWDAYYHRPFKP